MELGLANDLGEREPGRAPLNNKETRMKKLMLLLLALAGMFVLTGCPTGTADEVSYSNGENCDEPGCASASGPVILSEREARDKGRHVLCTYSSAGGCPQVFRYCFNPVTGDASIKTCRWYRYDYTDRWRQNCRVNKSRSDVFLFRFDTHCELVDGSDVTTARADYRAVSTACAALSPRSYRTLHPGTHCAKVAAARLDLEPSDVGPALETANANR